MTRTIFICCLFHCTAVKLLLTSSPVIPRHDTKRNVSSFVVALMLLIVKHFNITFGWTLVRLSSLIYPVQKTVPLSLFSCSRPLLAVDKVTDNRVIGAPDLVVEVDSPSTAIYDRHDKLEAPGMYFSQAIYRGKALLPSRIVPGFSVQVEQFFQ